MELQFRDTPLRCLRQSAADTQCAEQTLELRLPENMPPVGRVLGAWGQPLLRGKDWRGDHVAVSGGVMARALYEAEDGTGVHCVEGWIPFQLRWELSDSRSDGSVSVSCLLRSVDARQIGAEKLMLRATVSVMARAMEPETYSLWEPVEPPEDIHLLEESHQLCLPMEAGEKPLNLEEELVLPPGKTDIQKLLYYQLSPSVKEKKVMADKLVFRGAAQLHAVYLGVDGMLHVFDTQLPISQFAELEREYGPDSQLWIEPAVTDLELERLDDGRLRLKTGILGQYVVYDRPVVRVVRDAYSPLRPVQIHSQQIPLPAVWDQRREPIMIQQTLAEQADRVVDCSVYAAQPRMRPGDPLVQLEGTTGVLYYDADGRPQGVSAPFQQELALEETAGQMQAGLSSLMTAQVTPGVEDMAVQAELELDLWEMDAMGIDAVCGLTVGEMTQPDPQRPSLILRRAGDMTLWELAKSSGSTVDAIRAANGLDDEPERGRMLLIPVP